MCHIDSRRRRRERRNSLTVQGKEGGALREII
jgi:hypothetical protein